LKRSGYAEESPLKGTLSAPSVGFPAFFIAARFQPAAAKNGS
jgi:hypothetical protein